MLACACASGNESQAAEMQLCKGARWQEGGEVVQQKAGQPRGSGAREAMCHAAAAATSALRVTACMRGRVSFAVG
jgi:hypothetical protein